MFIVAVVLFVLALAVGVVAVASLSGRLPRNRWAGVRTPASMRNDATFALANKVAGPTMLAAAGLLAIGGVGALLLDTLPGMIGVVVALVAAVVTAGTGGSIGARAAAAAAPEVGGCGHSCAACSLKGVCQPS